MPLELSGEGLVEEGFFEFFERSEFLFKGENKALCSRLKLCNPAYCSGLHTKVWNANWIRLNRFLVKANLPRCTS